MAEHSITWEAWEPPTSCDKACEVSDSGPTIWTICVPRYRKDGSRIVDTTKVEHTRYCETCGKTWDMIGKEIVKPFIERIKPEAA